MAVDKTLERQERATRLVRDALVWDNHACMPLRVGDTRFMEDLERFRAAGVDVLTLNVAMDMLPWERTFKVLATFRSWLADHADRFSLPGSVEELLKAHQSGRMTVLFDIEGGAALDDCAELVEVYYRLGVRWMLIAYNRQNRLGSGCAVKDHGLTEFGRRTIDAMERVGMLLCCSHTGHRTALDAIAYSRNPVIFSHSNPTAVHANQRNISDDLITACAAKGGVICLTGFGPFVSDGVPSAESLVAHAEHVAALVGAEHLGLGSDFLFDPLEIHDFVPAYSDWFPGLSADAPPPPFLGPEAYTELAGHLLTRGWKEDEVRGLLGGNLLRVAKQVWR